MSAPPKALSPREKVNDLDVFLRSPRALAQIQSVLPPGMTPAHVVRTTISVVQATPSLIECTPISILNGIIRAGELRLHLATVLGQAFLVPRFNKKVGAMEAVFQIGYRGYLDLAYRSGKLSNITVRAVARGEDFQVEYGTANEIIHRPNLGLAEALTGQGVDNIAYYAVAKFISGGHDFEVMSRPQAEAHRAKYSPKGKYPTPWDTSFDAMAMKTVILKLCKRLPLSLELQVAAIADEKREALGDDEASSSPLELPAAPGPSRAEQVEHHLAGIRGQSQESGVRDQEPGVSEEAPGSEMTPDP